MRILVFSITLFSCFFAQGLLTKGQLKPVFKSCVKVGYEKKVCRCIMKNYKYLLDREAYPELVNIYKNLDKEGQQGLLVNMDITLHQECDKDSKYISPKAGCLKKKIERQNDERAKKGDKDEDC